MATADEALGMVNRLAAELNRRRPAITARLDAYKGLHRLQFASPEFSRYFEERFRGFSDNWCAPVVAAPTERMNYKGIRLGNGPVQADPDLARVSKVNNVDAGSSKAFIVGLAAARMFSLVWGDPDDEQTPRIFWEHPSNCIVGYDPETGAEVAGLKLWNADAYEYATLYLPDEVWKWQRRNGAGDSTAVRFYLPSTYRGGWEPRQSPADDTWPIPNPMGEVPLTEFRNQDLLDDEPISDIDGVLAMQSAINLTWAYLLNALDFASLPQRVVLGADIPKIPVLDNTGKVVGSRPLDLNTLPMERALWVPGENAKIAEWKVATLDGYGMAIEKAVEHVAAQTRTPPHYLIGKVANLSADALTAAETGLVTKAQERITYFSPPMRRTNRLVCLAQDNRAKADACRSGTIIWRDIQFRSLAQKADAYGKLKDIGFPFAWIAERWEDDPEEVARIISMRRTEATELAENMAASLAGTIPVGSDQNQPVDAG